MFKLDLEFTASKVLLIHNQGFHTIPFESSKKLAVKVAELFRSGGYIEDFDGSDEPISLLINNLGSTTTLELNCFALDCLEALGPRVQRFAIGTFMTALNMHGISVTVLVGKEWIPYLDQKTSARSWIPMTKISAPLKFLNPVEKLQEDVLNNTPSYYDEEHPGSAYNCVYRICQMLCQKQPFFDNLDEMIGDGDTGSTFARPCSRILNSIKIDQTPRKILEIVGDAVRRDMQGSSGALMTLLLDSVLESSELSISTFVAGLAEGIKRVTKYGGATVGDKTFLDSLVPGLEILSQNSTDFKNASNYSRIAAEGTAILESKAGRSAYQDSTIGKIDPGAMIIAEMFAVIADEMQANL